MSEIRNAFLQMLKAYITGERKTVSLGSSKAWEQFFQLAAKQEMGALICVALGSCDTDIPSRVRTCFLQEYTKRSAVFSLQRTEFSRISDALSREKIPFLRMKGMHLSDYYPDPVTRGSCDIDILYDSSRKEQIPPIMESLGFRYRGSTVKDDTWYKEPCVAVEMHYSLFGVDEYSMLKNFDPWDGAVPDPIFPGRLLMLPERNYVYQIFHFVKHLQYGGAKIRHLVDCELLLRKEREGMDWQLVQTVLNENGLDRIEKAVRHLLDVWFRGGERSKTDDVLEDTLYSGGKNSAFKNRVAQGFAHDVKGGAHSRTGYFFRRIFVPVSDIYERFPAAERHKILVPFFYLVRWIQALTPSSRKRLKNEVKVVKSISEDDMSSAGIIASLIER